MTNSYTIEDGLGLHALDANQQNRRGDGYGVIDPDAGDCLVTVGSGTLGQSGAISIATGDVLVDGTEHSVPPSTRQIETANASDPRRDVVYVDTNGDVQVAKGAAEAAQPEGENLSRFEFFRPAPADLENTTATVLAEVWVPAGASSITSNDIRDRRMATIGEHSLDFDATTQSELNTHASNSSAHHAKYTDEDARDAAGGMATDGLAYDDPNNELGLNVIKSDRALLSNGEQTISTGVPTSQIATFTVFLGPVDDDADVAAEIRADSGSGEYEIDIVETETSVGNPAVDYDIVRLR